MTSANGSPSKSSERLVALGLRATWFFAIPLLLAALTIRYLTPRAGSGDPLLDAVAAGLEDRELYLGLALFVGFSVLFRYWLPRLVRVQHATNARLPAWSRRAALVTSVCALAAGMAAWVIRAMVLEPCVVHGVSMLPTLEPRDTIAVTKLAYRRAGSVPRRGDIVVLRHDARRTEPSELVKRVIGLPGDQLVVGGGLTINGWKVPTCDAGRYFRSAEGRLVDGRLVIEYLEDAVYPVLELTGEHLPKRLEHTVEPGEVFVLGDDRGLSADSRAWGAAQARLGDVIGRVDRVLLREGPASLAASQRLLRPLNFDVKVDGVDMRDLEEGIRNCLAKRPSSTRPPAPALVALGTRVETAR